MKIKNKTRINGGLAILLNKIMVDFKAFKR